jgi:hypothetical protein
MGVRLPIVPHRETGRDLSRAAPAARREDDARACRSGHGHALAESEGLRQDRAEERCVAVGHREKVRMADAFGQGSRQGGMRATMRGAWILIVASGCGATEVLPRNAAEIVCPATTRRVSDRDSDVGWGGVEGTDGCERPDGKLEGAAILIVDGAPRETTLVGKYAGGMRVGTWVQYDERGAMLGRFTLDAAGTGVEVLRDSEGHSLRGAVVEGEREGEWKYYGSDGKLAATSTWSRGKLVRQDRPPPWDPPMLDDEDACPKDPEDRDGTAIEREGCPSPTHAPAP